MEGESGSNFRILTKTPTSPSELMRRAREEAKRKKNSKEIEEKTCEQEQADIQRRVKEMELEAYGATLSGQTKLVLGDEVDPRDSYMQNYHFRGEKYWFLGNPYGWGKRVKEAIEDFCFVPIPLRGKVPAADGWRQITLHNAGAFCLEHGWNAPDEKRKLFLSKVHRGFYNIGIATGEPSKVFVIDIDAKEEEGKLSALPFYNEILSSYATPTVRTGSGGYHVYFKWESDLEQIASDSAVVKRVSDQKPIGLDLKGKGGQVVFVGSVHPKTGKFYEWVEGKQMIKDVFLQPLPEELKDFFFKGKELKGYKYLSKPKNQRSMKSGGNFRSSFIGGAPSKNPEAVFESAFKACCEKWPDFANNFAMDRIIEDESGTVYCLKRLRPSHCEQCDREHEHENPFLTVGGDYQYVHFNCRRGQRQFVVALVEKIMFKPGTDKGDAIKFVSIMGDNIFRITEDDKLKVYIWSKGKRIWTVLPDECLRGKIGNKLAKDVHFRIKALSEDIEELKKKTQATKEDTSRLKALEKTREEVEGLISRYSSRASLNSIKDMVPFEVKEFKEAKDKINRASDLLPVAEGQVVDLRTGEARERKKEDYFTYEIPTKFTGLDKDSKYREFLRTIFNDNEELVEGLIDCQGYSITGETSEQVLFITEGEGANGKSLIYSLVSETLGPCYEIGSKSVVTGHIKDGAPDPSLAKLQGKRFVNIQETRTNEQFNEPSVKRATGCDSITCRDLYKSEITFKPTFKIWIATNNIPLSSCEESMLRRLKIINFPLVFKDTPTESHHRQRDPQMEKKLLTVEYRESCLAALVKGAMKFFAKGHIDYPESYKKSLDIYEAESSNVDYFIAKFYEIIPNEQQDLTLLENVETRKDISLVPQVFSGILYGQYKAFCETYRLKPLTQTKFGSDLRKMGIPSYIGAKNKKFYCFIKERPPPPPPSGQGGSLLWQ